MTPDPAANFPAGTHCSNPVVVVLRIPTRCFHVPWNHKAENSIVLASQVWLIQETLLRKAEEGNQREALHSSLMTCTAAGADQADAQQGERGRFRNNSNL